MIAGLSDESGRALAGVGSADRVGLADGRGLARVADAGVVQVTEETCLARWTLTNVLADAVDATTAVLAGVVLAIVDVALTVFAWKNRNATVNS